MALLCYPLEICHSHGTSMERGCRTISPRNGRFFIANCSITLCKLTVCSVCYRTWPFTVDLPIKNDDFPWLCERLQTLTKGYQRRPGGSPTILCPRPGKLFPSLTSFPMILTFAGEPDVPGCMKPRNYVILCQPSNR